MRSLIVSDLHGHNWPRFSTTLADGTNSRFADLLNILDQVEIYVREYQPESLLVLGDVTHRRYFIQFGLYTKLADRLLRLKKLVKRLTLLVGNHDIESQGTHSLGPLALMGLDVIDRPAWRSEGLFVPYMHEGIALAVTEPPAEGQTRANVGRVFLHYAIDGHVMSNEFALPSALKLEHLDNFDQIIMGHLHHPQVEQDGRVIYVGAPMHFDFGDRGDRYCWLLEWETGAMTPLPLYAPRFVTTAYPRIPVPPDAGLLGPSGCAFLRVLNVPSKITQDVKEQAVKVGWTDAVTVPAQVPQEFIAINATTVIPADQVAEYVARQYGDLTPEARQPIVDYGLSCLRAVEEGQ